MWQPYQGSGVQMIGVNRVGVTTGSVSDVEGFVADTGATFPMGFDLSRSYDPLRAAATMGSSPNSVHIVIDRDGTIAYLSRRYDAGMVAAIDALVNAP